MSNFFIDNIYVIAILVFIVWFGILMGINRRKTKTKRKHTTVLWVDDVRNPFKMKWANTIIDEFPHFVDFEVVWVMNYDGFVSYVRFFGVPDAISFDHNLGPGQSGYDCAKWLVDYCMDRKVAIPEYRVHSSNPVGKENILAYLGNAKKHLYAK